MKQLNSYIVEKLKINKDIVYHYYPKTRTELQSLLKKLLKERGNNADLNDIDVSNITNMSNLFKNSEFNGDISKWDVSNVKDMNSMFYNSEFNGDISKWDVSSVINIDYMFAYSKFNKDISQWNITMDDYIGSSGKNLHSKDTFIYSKLRKNKKVPKWYHNLY